MNSKVAPDNPANLIAICLHSSYINLVPPKTFTLALLPRSPWSKRCVEHPLQMAAVLFVCAVSGPFTSLAQASCGDYLRDTSTRTSDHSVPLPCNGPHCGRRRHNRWCRYRPPARAPDRDLAIVHTAGLSLQDAVCIDWVIVTRSGPQHLALRQFRPPRTLDFSGHPSIAHSQRMSWVSRRVTERSSRNHESTTDSAC